MQVERQAIKSPTDWSKAENSPRFMTHLRSAAEITFIATTPPRDPESSREVTGQMVREEASIICSACNTESLHITETLIIVSLQSKVLAERACNTADVAGRRTARSMKSVQEKTWTNSPLSPTIGTRRTHACPGGPFGRAGCSASFRSGNGSAMSLRTLLKGSFTDILAKDEWPEQLARAPTGIDIICAIFSAMLQEGEHAVTSWRFMSM
mmetsp:Transcript_115917/g.247710  ORF Transcript_115917/g.247710 Transcript_115917/m.247710 type:complete len:210 (+) Transcript_115917:291-920(+)